MRRILLDNNISEASGNAKVMTDFPGDSDEILCYVLQEILIYIYIHANLSNIVVLPLSSIFRGKTPYSRSPIYSQVHCVPKP